MYMPRYLTVSHQTSSDLSLVTIFLHFALKRGPIRAQDDFLTFTIICIALYLLDIIYTTQLKTVVQTFVFVHSICVPTQVYCWSREKLSESDFLEYFS